jgi:hypothetical protein
VFFFWFCFPSFSLYVLAIHVSESRPNEKDSVLMQVTKLFKEFIVARSDKPKKK